MKTSLLTVYTLLKNDEITLEEAASTLGLSPMSLKMRIAKHGPRLPTTLAVLDDINQDKVTRTTAANILGVGPRDINALMKSWNVKRPLKPYLVSRAASKVKWELRKKAAIDFIASEDLEDCAEIADISVRQMRRWVSLLLKKHFEMTWKELKELPQARRKRLAEEIEKAENLELARQQALKSVILGNKTVTEEAIERLLEKEKRDV